MVFGDGFKAMMAIKGIRVPNREVMAIATLMYGSLPVQKCLVMGSANRQDLRSWQCSMEDLQSGLQSFPTLWHTLVTACYGHDAWSFVGAVRPKSGTLISPYFINGREGVIMLEGLFYCQMDIIGH